VAIARLGQLALGPIAQSEAGRFGLESALNSIDGLPFARCENSDLIKTNNQSMETTMSEPNEKALVAQILSSYLSNNTVAAADLPSVIDSVKRAFVGSGEAGGMENAPKALARIILAEQVRRGARP
jgi:hypothetical protein